ncbi:MAG TPA: hypothetical protein VMY42_24350 [Thermoguttaceae bacterium]|nr:hypothetical protein [Thermoguttaceae bacterium]
MNLVGKIFTVLILVMSVGFCTASVYVFATHKNWKELAEKEQNNLAVEKEKNDNLQTDKDNLESEIKKEKSAYEAALARLDTETIRLAGEVDQLQQENDNLVKQNGEHMVAARAAEESSNLLRTQVDTLRTEKITAQQERDGHFNQVVLLTDHLHNLINEQKRLEDRNVRTAEDLGKATEVLRKFGLAPEPELYPGPPWIDGLVLSTTGGDLITVSLGTDDGLLKGHLLDVVRAGGSGSSYVGKVQVVKTEADESVCKIDPNYLKSPVRRWDFVTTKLTRPAYVTTKLD